MHDETDLLPGSPLYTSSLSSHQHVDPFADQNALDLVGHVTILTGHELRLLLDDGHPTTEPTVCLRQFETDIASPEHDQVRRQVVEIQCLDVRERSGRLEVIHRAGPRGFGRSMLDGLSRAAAGTADLVIQMDADLSHDPKYLPQLAAAAEQADLVVGSRYLHGVSVVNWPLHRIILSSFANQYIRAVIGLEEKDCTTGFRCWRRDALARLPLDTLVADGYAFLVEMLFEASRRGCRIGEVPIIFVERRQGQSKVSGSVLLESLITPWRLLFRKTP